MRYVAAYLLAVLGGNNSPKAKDIKKILTSVGIDADDALLNKVIDELNGKSIEELIAEGEQLHALGWMIRLRQCDNTNQIPFSNISDFKGRYGTYFHIHPRVVIFGYIMYLWKTSNLSVGHVIEFSSATEKAEINAIFSCDQAALQMVFSVRPSVCLSVRLSVTPFSPCSHHRILMKFSGVITMVKSDVHAKG